MVKNPQGVASDEVRGPGTSGRPPSALAFGRGPVARIEAVFRSRRAGLALVGFSAVSFAVLTVLAVFAQGSLLAVDRPVRDWLIGTRSGPLNEAMSWVTLLGARYVIGPLLVALAAWALLTRRCRVILAVLVVAFVLNPAIEFVLKAAIDRPRPDLLRLVAGRGPSFPSGHVVAAVGFYGMLPVLVSRMTDRLALRAGAFLAATAVILAVGFSRMFLGVHWLTDVVGGYLLGTVVVLGTYEALAGHRFDGEGPCEPRRTWIGHRDRSPSILVR